VAKPGRNDPCGCGSGRKAKRCCGVERGPSEESLARAYLSHASWEAAVELARVSDSELDVLLDAILDLPARDLSLQVELPQLVSPTLDHLCDAVADDDPDAAKEPFTEVLRRIDNITQRQRLACAVIALRERGALDAKLAAAAIIDLASGSRELLGASLLEAVAVRVGAARTPGGLLLAA
jgi:hypothetical protein